MNDTLKANLAASFIPALGKTEDNHGNIQHGLQITCKGGTVLDYGILNQIVDAQSVKVMGDTTSLLPLEIDLGDLESPLKTRCDDAGRSR